MIDMTDPDQRSHAPVVPGLEPRLVPQHDTAAVLAAGSPAHLDEIVARLREQWHGRRHPDIAYLSREGD